MTRQTPRTLGPQVLFAFVCATALSACATAPGAAPPASQGSSPAVRDAERPATMPPQTYLMRPDQLQRAKLRLAAGDSTLRPAYDHLLRLAEAALATPPVSVTAKQLLPPSGDRHDFLSFGPYWWPDSTKPGGMPYVRRDGVVNPASRVDHDGWRMAAMRDAVEALALAWWFTGDERYAEGAARHLRVFFLDSATRMNPHLQYAQSIPGVSAGRGIGILDSRHLVTLGDAVRLLERSAAWTERDEAGLQQWMRTYLHWLRTSDNGRDEADEENNHGTYYDMQVAGIGLYLGDTAYVRDVIEGTKRRIDHHFERDGSQPLELARTRPLHYSIFNLDAYTQLAEMARTVGVDLWRYESPKGATLGAALRFVAPFADSTRARPWRDVSPVVPNAFVMPMRRAALALGDAAFIEALSHTSQEFRDTDPSRLYFVDVPSVAWADAADLAARARADSIADAALARAAAQLRRTATTLDPAAGYPRVTRADGSWEQHPARQWTSGFFPGTLWYLYQYTRDPEWRRLAARWTAGLEPVKRVTTTHDLGFMVFNSFGHGYLLTGNEHYKGVVMEASRSLATRYNPRVGAIKSWDTEHVSDRRSTWRYPVIVDNLMNLEMLFWAGTHGGDTAWTRMAARHATTSARVHLRPDGSTVHAALFDPATGALERTHTWQGLNDSSAWARGQAWAIHGLAASYGRTREPQLLDAARRAADWFVAHMPAGAIPYWDFRHPDIPRTERDASAGAIAASGLYDLARYVDAHAAARYRTAAERMVVALATGYTAPDSPAGPLLLHSVGQRPQNVEIDVGLVYADYYFVEALLRRRGLFLE